MIHHLEDILSELGLKQDLNNEPICSPILNSPPLLESNKQVNLYYYPSLNSPYTYANAKRVREMKDDYPVNLKTKPVLTMLMRNMKIIDLKAKYIISDAASEARKHE